MKILLLVIGLIFLATTSPLAFETPVIDSCVTTFYSSRTPLNWWNTENGSLVYHTKYEMDEVDPWDNKVYNYTERSEDSLLIIQLDKASPDGMILIIVMIAPGPYGDIFEGSLLFEACFVISGQINMGDRYGNESIQLNGTGIYWGNIPGGKNAQGFFEANLWYDHRDRSMTIRNGKIKGGNNWHILDGRFHGKLPLAGP